MRFFAVLLFCVPALAGADATETLVEHLDALESMEGRFEQMTLDQDGTRLQEASGDLVVARPNRFRWETTEPFEQLVVSDGKQVWVHDIDLEQVVVRPLEEEISKTPALLFGGTPEKIGRSFQVTEVEHSGERRVFRLEPHKSEEQPLFSLLEVTFSDGKPLSMRLEDALGQRTTIDFRDLEINTELSPDTFSFEPPEGADVIRQEP